MEVRCNRCGTEYEFDDVLISERGTTVKCTNCGFQFKVFAPDSRVRAPERWLVRTVAGDEIAFGSLRELQRGIAERRVGQLDSLSRGDDPPRKLGLIAELEPFFVGQDSAPRPPIQRTLHGVAPERTSEASLRPSAPETVVEQRPLDAPEYGAAAPTLRTTPVPEPQPKSAAPPSAVVARSSTPPEVSAPPEAPAQAQPSPRATELAYPPIERINATPATRAAMESLTATLPSAPAPAAASSRPLSSAPVLDLDHDDVEPTFSARSRWIAALVVGGVFVLLALTVGRRYLTRDQAPETRDAASVSSPRVAELLSESNRLLDDGDWDAAHERLLKASALAESDGRVLSALARLEALRTDLVWLDLKLLEPDARDALATRQRELDRRLVRTAQATDAALAEAPKDPVALRAQIDWLRMKGDTQAARKRLGPISEKASDPANAYVLAALDLAEESPAWPNVIDRLRLASSVEPGGGRAQAALVYALARAGKAPEADSELAKIGTNSPVFTLVPALKAFVAKNSRRAPPAPTAARPPVNAAPAQGAPARVAAVADVRPLLAQARVAANNGQYSVAEELYSRVLEARPTNIEALGALGDIARKRKDPARAQELYERALAQDPGYKPAIRGSARLAEDIEARKGPSPVVPPEAKSAAFPPPPDSPSADAAPSAAPAPTTPPEKPNQPTPDNTVPAEHK